MVDNKRVDEPTGTETVGHEWDGIEELNTPLPRWWLWTFIGCVVWAIVFTIFFPAWPMLSRATEGVLGWSSRGQLATEMQARADQLAPIRAALASTPIDQLPRNPALMQQAVEGGRAAFRLHCVQCHGSGAAGTPGFPNLNDDDWLWGGDLNAIHFTIENGVRNPGHPATRTSQMPAFGRDGILTGEQIGDLTAFVRTISRQQPADPAARRGQALFAANCAVCHGDRGQGNRTVGAPNLTDGIWLYGGGDAAIRETITNARAGVMPRWGGRLDAATINMLTAYVHSLGGGEAAQPAQ